MGDFLYKGGYRGNLSLHERYSLRISLRQRLVAINSDSSIPGRKQSLLLP